jgi:hypothetical protein
MVPNYLSVCLSVCLSPVSLPGTRDWIDGPELIGEGVNTAPGRSGGSKGRAECGALCWGDG